MGNHLISGIHRKNIASAPEAVDDDIDLDAIDAAMGDENAAEADLIDNIDMEDMKDALSDAKDSPAVAGAPANAAPQALASEVVAGAGVNEVEEKKADVATTKSVIRVSSSAAEAAAEDEEEEDAEGASRPRKRVKFNEPAAANSQYQNSR